MIIRLGMTIIGAGFGLLVALIALASGDMPDPTSARVFDVLGKPVALFVWFLEKLLGLSEGNLMPLWFVLHFVYWMFIGALLGWLVGALCLKLFGNIK
jgi:hypothetical protein